ncbi:MAG: hypothetical protein WC565_05970 [Parcubacteria group bacterium]|jgi:hypothetical protein
MIRLSELREYGPCTFSSWTTVDLLQTLDSLREEEYPIEMAPVIFLLAEIVARLFRAAEGREKIGATE